jgi:hypothetical protein
MQQQTFRAQTAQTVAVVDRLGLVVSQAAGLERRDRLVGQFMAALALLLWSIENEICTCD